MLETLAELDRSLFLFFNVGLANPVTDFVMPIVTSDHLLRVGYVLAMLLILWKGDARMRWLVLVSIIVLTFTDQLSAGLLKPMIGRLRPCHVLDNINLLVGCGGGKAMPSSHTANAFGQAILFALLYIRVRWWLVGVATLIAVSRVFVGVHYPADVIAGALLGTVVALALAFVFERVMEKRLPGIKKGDSDMSIKMTVVQGDITEAEVDAIVNAANNHFWMGSGVAGAIKAAGGTVIEEEAIAKGPVMPGNAVYTGAGKLPYKCIIHGAVMGQDLHTTNTLIRQTTIACLNIADKLKLESIAFPAFGTGVGGFPLKACANLMVDAVRTWGDLAKYVTEVTFCLYDDLTYGIFREVVKRKSV